MGYYFNDSLSIDDVHLTGITMGLARQGSSRTLVGVESTFGIGFPAGETANQPGRTDQPFTYPTVLDKMVEQGLIKSRSYSIWLDNMWNNTGVILFGGVDPEKYQGKMVTLPIVEDPVTHKRDRMLIEWSGLTINRGDAKHTTSTYNVSPARSLPALLDTGSTFTYLPDHIVRAMYAHIGAKVREDGMPTVPCNIPRDHTFTFIFGGKADAKVSVSIDELIQPLASNKDVCQFLIIGAGNLPFAILGDSFLRSAYVVYNLDQSTIGIAQTNFKATATADGDKLTPITSGIPSRPAKGAGLNTRASLKGMVIITIMTLLWLAI